METKEDLMKKVRDLEIKEAEDKENKRREDNYKKFAERPEDWVIGKAHCELSFHDNGWHHPKGKQLPSSVSVGGNCGHDYFPTAWITEATGIYFHNVWTTQQQNSFQKALNTLVQKHVEKIAKSLVQTLEIMGLQSTHYKLTHDYPVDKVKEIEKEIADSQAKVLDKYTDKEFKDLVKHQVWWEENSTEPKEEREVQLSHSRRILFDYIKNYRPKLINHFKDCRYF